MFAGIIKQLARPLTLPFREVLAKVDEALVNLGDGVKNHSGRIEQLESKTERLDKLYSWVDLTQFLLQYQGLACGIYCVKCGHVSRSQDMHERRRVGVGEGQAEWLCQACEHTIRVGDVVEPVGEPLGAAEEPRVDTEPAAAAPSTSVIYNLVNDGPVGSFIATAEVARRLDLPAFTVNRDLERLRQDGFVAEAGPGVWERIK
jgi:hypothetical protein